MRGGKRKEEEEEETLDKSAPILSRFLSPSTICYATVTTYKEKRALLRTISCIRSMSAVLYVLVQYINYGITWHNSFRHSYLHLFVLSVFLFLHRKVYFEYENNFSYVGQRQYEMLILNRTCTILVVVLSSSY